MRVIAAGSTLILAVLAIFLWRPGPIADLDEKVCDVLTGWAGPGRPSGQVAIVQIDEKSLDRFGRWPWPRPLMGRLSQSILKAGASTVALDMVFAQQDGADDRAFAEALTGQPTVTGFVLKFDGSKANSTTCPGPGLPLVFASPDNSLNQAFFHATGAVCSPQAIGSATSASGFLNAAPDHDGILRRVPVAIGYGDREYPSLALAAVNTYRHTGTMQLAEDRGGAWRLRLDRAVIPLEAKGELRLRFRNSEGRFPAVSAMEVMDGNVPGDVLRGKIVIVGGSALGMDSPVVTNHNPFFPAVAVQATAVDNLLSGDSFYRPDKGPFWELSFALLVGCASTVLLSHTRFLWGALSTVVLAGTVWLVCAIVLSTTGAMYSPLPATAALASALPVLTLLHYLHEKRRADLAQSQLVETLQHSRTVLERSEHRYRRLVENINDAIIMDNVEGRLIFANQRFREWFGIGEGEEGNLRLEDYVAPEWLTEVRDRHDRRMRDEEMADHFEFEGIRSDGTRICIEALVTTIKESGKIVGSQAALRDVTERKRMEGQYLQSQKMESVGRLAGGVAHDFNNLLTVINGYSGMLLGKIDRDDATWHYAEQIHKAGERAADLTQKLLTFSRKQKVNLKPVNLNLLVADTKKMLDRLIGEDISLTTRLSPELELVVADPGQIHQVLLNLVVNARDAMPQGGDVIIETKSVAGGAAGPYVCLGVLDTGTGMAEEVKRHLFEPFFTTKEQGKGTGLGLATVYGIVQQCGGRIEVSSLVGKGTTFQIFLPVAKSAAVEQGAPTVIAASLRGTETLLLVEDQDAVREFTATLLEGFGYQVLQASNGPEAIALAELHAAAIDLLITDIVLPVMDGRVLAERLRAVHPETRVLYISGYSEERIGQSQELDGRLPLLQKPFTPEALGARVREILNETDQQQEAKG